MKLWLSALGATMLMQLVASFMGQSLPVIAPLMMASTTTFCLVGGYFCVVFLLLFRLVWIDTVATSRVFVFCCSIGDQGRLMASVSFT